MRNHESQKLNPALDPVLIDQEFVEVIAHDDKTAISNDIVSPSRAMRQMGLRLAIVRTVLVLRRGSVYSGLGQAMQAKDDG